MQPRHAMSCHVLQPSTPWGYENRKVRMASMSPPSSPKHNRSRRGDFWGGWIFFGVIDGWLVFSHELQGFIYSTIPAGWVWDFFFLIFWGLSGGPPYYNHRKLHEKKSKARKLDRLVLSLGDFKGFLQFLSVVSMWLWQKIGFSDWACWDWGFAHLVVLGREFHYVITCTQSKFEV